MTIVALALAVFATAISVINVLVARRQRDRIKHHEEIASAICLSHACVLAYFDDVGVHLQTYIPEVIDANEVPQPPNSEEST